MARYTGPKSKISRKFGEPIYGGTDKSLDKKNHPPGQHGSTRRRKTRSEYALQLAEKQKAKYIYGLLERQFRKVYHEASRKKGTTGELLLQFLESRLDNTVYRLGIAPSRRAARQLVSHKHIQVNGKGVNIPSFMLRPGDLVTVKDKTRSNEMIQKTLQAEASKYPWLEWDQDKYTGKFLSYPEREKIPEKIKEQLIVELYSK